MGRISHHLKGKDYKKTHQRRLDEQRALYLERREKEIQEENEKNKIEEAAKAFKSNWRTELLREFGEWIPVANAGGPTMGTSTTFGYYVGGSPVINSETGQPITYTASGLGGVEALPTIVTIDQGFGDTANVDAPTYNQLSLAGYAPTLPFFRRDDYKDVNAMLDASQEYARRVLADVYMGARVELNREIDRQESERNEMMNKVSSYVSQLGIDFEELQKGAQIDKYGRLVVLNYDGGVLGGLKNSNNRSITIYNPAKDAQGNLLKIQDTGNKTLQKGETVFGTQYSPMPDETTVQTWSNVGDVSHFTDFGSDHNPNEIGEVLVGPKIVGPLIKDPNNPEYNKRFAPITAADESSIAKLETDWGKLTKLYPDLKWIQQLGIDYARGKVGKSRTRTVSPSPMYNAGVLKAIEHNLGLKDSTPGAVSSYDHMNYLDIVQTATTKLSMGRFGYKVTADGIRVNDFFDFDKNKSLGFFANVPKLNQTAERIIDLGQRRAAQMGYKMVHTMTDKKTGKKVEVPINPGDGSYSPEGYGIPIDFTIPWSQVPANLENKLRKKTQKESSTWDRTKKHLKGA